MGEGAAYNYIAMKEAIEHSGLDEELISNVNTGLVMGSGGPSTYQLQQAFDIAREKGVKKIGPYMVTRTMASGNSATLATPFKIKGVNYSISSACSTSLHCIGNAYDLIRHGQQEIVFAGGGEENFDKDTQVRVTYDKVKNINLVRPTIKRYLAGFTKSQFRRIDADEFVVATLLPVQRFKKASADKVWSESRKMI